MSGLDDLVHGGEHLLHKGEKNLGDAVEGFTQSNAYVLDKVGLHTVARGARHLGDSVADHLGSQVPEAQLGESDRPADLLHGDPHALEETAGHLHRFAGAFRETGHALRGLDVGHWRGEAADAFHQEYTPHPAKWTDAGDACEQAAKALDSYAATVRWAQQQARQAIEEYRSATRASQAARDRYDTRVRDYDAALILHDKAGGKDAPTDPGAFHDPGKAGQAAAREKLDEARRQRDTEGELAQRLITAALEHAPAAPPFSLTRAFGDEITYNVLSGEHFLGGAAKGLGGMVKFARSLDPHDPYNMAHPALYLDHLNATAMGLLHSGNHPEVAVSSLLGSGWRSDFSQSLGTLFANLAAGTVTDGASTEAGIADRAVADAAEHPGPAADALVDDPVEHELPPWYLAHDDAPPAPVEPAPQPRQGMHDGLRFDDNDSGEAWAREHMPLPDLTDDERHVLHGYTGAFNGPINRALRGEEGSPLDGRIGGYVHHLDSAIAKSHTPQSILVHRGVGRPYAESLGVDIHSTESMRKLVGRTFTEKGYMSTSIGSSAAFDSSDIRLMVRVPEGHPAIDLIPLSVHDEREILVSRDSDYVVHGVYKADGKWHIEAEILPKGWTKPEGWTATPYGDAQKGYPQ